MERRETNTVRYGEAPVVLVVEDNPAEQLLIRRAFRRAGFECALKFAEDGELGLNYLERRGSFSKPEDAPRPHLVLLDLNMPKVDGFEFLERIKKTEALSSIPVVVLTTSPREEDIQRCYQAGCASFIRKPPTWKQLVALCASLQDYWFGKVSLPAMTSDT